MKILDYFFFYSKFRRFLVFFVFFTNFIIYIPDFSNLIDLIHIDDIIQVPDPFRRFRFIFRL